MPKILPSIAELAIEFAPKLNHWVQFSVGLDRDIPYHWLGKCEHVWSNTINERLKGKRCPACTIRKVVSGVTDLGTLHPDVAKLWHPTLNNGVLPKQVPAKSAFLAWWICDLGHEYPAQVHRQTDGQGCSVCAGKRVLAGFNDLAFKNPLLAAQWHPTKNGDLLPSQVTAFSEKLVWWYRKSCGHEWRSRISNRKGGLECSVCLGFIVLAGFNDLESQNPIIAAEWHPTKNGDLSPSQVTTGYSKPVWWLGSCGHEYPARVDHRHTARSGCSVCAGKRVISKINSLAATHKFIAGQWDYDCPLNDGLSPETVTAGSNKITGWICNTDSDHRWPAQVKDRTRKDPTGCPFCIAKVSKAEGEVVNFVKSLGLKVYTSNRGLLSGQEVDIYLPDQKIAIEFNGVYWHSDAQRKQPDYHFSKWDRLRRKGIQLIQVWEDDWTFRPDLVKSMLIRKLGLQEFLPEAETDGGIVSITEAAARAFLVDYHLLKFAPATYHVGLCDGGGKVLTVMGVQNLDEGIFEVVRYAERSPVAGGFALLLAHIENTYNVKQVTGVMDHCVGVDDLYVAHGFTMVEELAPDYMYVVNRQRVSQHEVNNLTDLNNLPRIWDAGKTRWMKTY